MADAAAATTRTASRLREARARGLDAPVEAKATIAAFGRGHLQALPPPTRAALEVTEVLVEVAHPDPHLLAEDLEGERLGLEELAELLAPGLGGLGVAGVGNVHPDRVTSGPRVERSGEDATWN